MSHTHAPPHTVVQTLQAKGIRIKAFLGKGAYSTVWSAEDATRGKVFAAKMISTATLRMRKIPTERLLREIEIMQRLQHPKIVALDQVIACGDDMLVLLMELVRGRELFDVVMEKGRLSEPVARHIIEQLLQAVQYMHAENVVHRDIKPENIMVHFDPHTSVAAVKLIDFGLGKVVSSFIAPTSFVGTPEYFAPEVDPSLRQGDPEVGYTSAVDMWSIGIVLFVMLAGHFPQKADDPMLAEAEALKTLSDEGRDFLLRLLKRNPRERMDATAALAHPWMLSGGCRKMHESGASTTDIVACQKRYQLEQSMKHAALMQSSIAERFHSSYEMALGVPAVAMSIRMSAMHCREQFTTTTKLLHDMRGYAENVIEMSDDVRVALEEGEPGLAVHFFQTTASIIDAIKQRTDAVVANNARIMTSLHEAIGLARLGGTMSDLLDDEAATVSLLEDEVKGGGVEGGGADDDEAVAAAMSAAAAATAAAAAAAATPLLAPSMQKLRESIQRAAADGSTLTDEEMLELCFPMLQIGSQLGSATPRSPKTRSNSTPLFMAAPELKLEPQARSDGGASSSTGSTGARGGGGAQQLNAQSPDVHANLLDAANKLQEVDQILMEAQRFWSLMQSAMETLLTRNEYIAGMLHFTRNAKMRERYLVRMDDYLAKWRAADATARAYLEVTRATHSRGFAFLNNPYDSASIQKAVQAVGGGSARDEAAGSMMSIADTPATVSSAGFATLTSLDSL